MDTIKRAVADFMDKMLRTEEGLEQLWRVSSPRPGKMRGYPSARGRGKRLAREEHIETVRRQQAQGLEWARVRHRRHERHSNVV